MHLPQTENKIEAGDCGGKLRKVNNISLLCYLKLFPVTGAGINLVLRLRIRESDS